jgi:magnesium chelatase family protein
MLAARLPGILPQLSVEESLEVSALHSLAGENLNDGLITAAPYSDPHHTATMSAMVGGGSRIARPGAISMAHRGVLFLDEAPEFSAKVLDALRTPMESGWVTIARSHGMVRYPARFQLVLAANPCPCGLSTTQGGASCQCSSMMVRRYRQRLSGPVLDRIDIQQLLLPSPKTVRPGTPITSESSAKVAARVAEARQRQRHRLAGTGWSVNAEVPGYVLRGKLGELPAMRLLDDAAIRGKLSARGADKVLRVAQTIADLAGHGVPKEEDFAAAMGLHEGKWGQL